MTTREPFAGGDQDYLKTVQYSDGTNLDIRTQLHQRFSTASAAFPDFEAGLIPWRPGLEVLDCGTGTGRFWDNEHSPKSCSIVVTDLSPGMVEAAVERARTNGFDQVTGQECDVQQLPFADNSFDVVVANHMLYHVPDPDLAIAELARVVRPGGALLASTNGYGHMGEMKAAIDEVFGFREDSLYDVFGIDTGEARLREQFATVSWHAYDNDLIVDDPAAAVAYGLSFPPGEGADADQTAAFTAAIGRRFSPGPMRIRTRTGAFVCTTPRSRSARVLG